MSATFTTKTSDKEEPQDFIDGLIGDDWKGLATASYDLAIVNGKSHKEAMQKVYSALLRIANEILPE